MRLTERTCPDCQSKFDLIKDKYFVKKPSQFVIIVNAIIRCIIFTTKVTIGDSKLICEACHREDKLKKILK
jgi:hypothetical protein